MKPPIYLITNKIKRLSPMHRMAFLSSIIKVEPRRSFYRKQLEQLLKSEVMKALKRVQRHTALPSRSEKSGESVGASA